MPKIRQRLTFVCALATLGSLSYPLSVSAGPEDAVTYIERQLRGKTPPGGRRMSAAAGALRGIDINSSVDIEIKSGMLTAAVLSKVPAGSLSAHERATLAQLTMLNRSVSQIDPAMRGFKDLFVLWGAAASSGNFDVFSAARNEAAPAMNNLVNTLYEATKQRMIASGMSESVAGKEADKGIDAIYKGDLVAGYNWDVLHKLFEIEIHLVEAQLANIADGTGLEVAIEGHLVLGPTEAVAIYLRNYNEVPTGPKSVYRKIRFEIPPEAVVLRDEYQKVADEIGDARNLGDVLRKSLEAEYERNEEQIRALLAGVSSTIDSAEEALNSLVEWRDPAKRSEWFDNVRSTLEQSPEGQVAISALSDVEQAYVEIEEDIAALRDYADLDKSLAGAATPEDALSLILSTFKSLGLAGFDDVSRPGFRVLNSKTWEDRIKTIEALIASVEALADPLQDELLADDGPVGDLIALRDSGQQLLDAVGAVSMNSISALFSFGSSAPINFAAKLPTPVGQTKLGLTLDADLDTSFDLKTIVQSRAPDNEVWITYRFYHGEEEIPGTSWQDKFLVRVFGWQDHVTAGIAFVQQDSARTWKPTGSLSWLLNKRRWPKDGENGLHGLGQPQWFSGFGLSTMPLDFDAETDVELGVAATVSFLDDWVVAGYGINMNTPTDNTYWFISLRLFKNNGFMKRTE